MYAAIVVAAVVHRGSVDTAAGHIIGMKNETSNKVQFVNFMHRTANTHTQNERTCTQISWYIFMYILYILPSAIISFVCECPCDAPFTYTLRMRSATSSELGKWTNKQQQQQKKKQERKMYSRQRLGHIGNQITKYEKRKMLFSAERWMCRCVCVCSRREVWKCRHL